MRDTFTSTAADAGRFDYTSNALGGSDAPSMSDLMDESPIPVPSTACPYGCGARYWAETGAFRRHMDYRDEFGVCRPSLLS